MQTWRSIDRRRPSGACLEAPMHPVILIWHVINTVLQTLLHRRSIRRQVRVAKVRPANMNSPVVASACHADSHSNHLVATGACKSG